MSQKKNKINNNFIQEKTILIQKKQKIGFIKSLKNNLINTSKYIGKGLIQLIQGKKIDKNLYQSIEDKLIMSDIGIQTTNYLMNSIKNNKNLNNLEIINNLKINMYNILKNVEIPLNIFKKPFIILVVGVNGVGKTTTAAKIAYYYKNLNYSTMIVAGDTFRAAAKDQLEYWGNKENIYIFSNKNRSDASSIIFDAINYAIKKKIDILIIDTAGRLHNKIYLMQELSKIKNTISKLDNSAPHETMLILDANIGQNSINQTKFFNECLNINGLTLTKIDGTSKGGILFNLSKQFNIPIRYISLGEKIKDLKVFKAKKFIDAIFNVN